MKTFLCFSNDGYFGDSIPLKLLIKNVIYKYILFVCSDSCMPVDGDTYLL